MLLLNYLVGFSVILFHIIAISFKSIDLGSFGLMIKISAF